MSTNQTSPTKATVWEDSDPINVARLQHEGGDAVQADFSTISFRVDKDVLADGTGTQVTNTTSLTVSDVIFDTLQTDLGLPDSNGYNFKHQVPNTSLPDGGETYVVTYKAEDTNSKVFFWEYELTTKHQRFS